MSDKSELPVKVITPHEGAEAFSFAFSSMIKDFSQSRALAWRMLLRDVRAMYRQSLLGYVWMILPPIATAFVWVFLNDRNLVNIETGDVPYTLFVLTGSILWAAFNGAMVSMQGIMGGAKNMLSKVNFPHEALVLTGFGKALLNSAIPMLVLIPALIVFDVDFQFSMFLFVVGFFTLILLGGAIGLIFVPIGALYGDVARALQLALRFGFFVTPVIYALPDSGATRTLLLLNPVTAPLVSARSWLLGGEDPVVMLMLVIAMVSLLLLVIGVIFFKVTMPHIIERLNA